ncbi:hypothetical protein DL98DRAFT_511972 [Cadophora sp. DSE1049]|nr:hypothetical protein DL98DRAFT_511972 [Cadophora sp. DSE1049]
MKSRWSGDPYSDEGGSSQPVTPPKSQPLTTGIPAHYLHPTLHQQVPSSSIHSPKGTFSAGVAIGVGMFTYRRSYINSPA